MSDMTLLAKSGGKSGTWTRDATGQIIHEK